MQRSLYFTGAGLSKSLQVPGKTIPTMLDFIKCLLFLLSSDVGEPGVAEDESVDDFLAELEKWRSL